MQRNNFQFLPQPATWFLRSTDSIDTFVVVVKEAGLVGADDDEEDDEGYDIDDWFDDPVEANEDCCANDGHHCRIVEVL